MAFQAVANSGSITKAAQLLHVSQPSISKHVKNLERDCGVKLFERNAGAAELTDAGSSLLRHVDAILVHLEEAKKELRSPKNLPKSDPLKVAGSYAASALLLPSLLVNFKSKHRDTSIILRSGTTREVKSKRKACRVCRTESSARQEEKVNHIRPSSSRAGDHRNGKRRRQDAQPSRAGRIRS